MIDLLIYLLMFIILLFVSHKNYKIICFIIITILSVQLILAYYVSFGLIQDPLFYLVLCSFIDLVMVFCVIINNIKNKKYYIGMSILALFSVFANVLCVFNYYTFYYFQYSYLIIMEYAFFTVDYKVDFKYSYYIISLFLILPHILT